MPARTPEEIHEMFNTAFATGDLDSVVSLYEPGATLAAQPGQVVSGPAAIRESLGGFFALKPKFNLQPFRVFRTDDIALLISNWALTGTGPDGNPVELSGQTTDVARRQPDGTWLLVIDNPWGVQ